MEVLKAINAVQAALVMQGGISKDRKNQKQGYSFRGIDDMYNTIAPIMAHAGLVVLPSYSDRHVVERMSQNDNALFYVTLRGDFTFRSIKDSSEVKVSTYGEAMDSGDKATNKAMSAALKYAFMQTFTIPTEGDNDSENQTHEVAAKKTITPTTGMFESLTIDMQNSVMDIVHRTESLFKRGDEAGAWAEWSASIRAISEEPHGDIARAVAWNRMDSKVRTALAKLVPAKTKEAA